MVTRKQHASFWECLNVDGKDRPRKNPYGYPLALVQWVSYHVPDGAQVNCRKSHNFGRVVEVSAPAQVWEKAWVDLAQENGRLLSRQFGRIVEDDHGIWGVFEGTEHRVKLVYRNGTQLEMVESGYVPVGQYKGGELWVRDESIGKE